MKMFEVGGCVRDELLGLKSKDIDFSVVLDEDEFIRFGHSDPFNYMSGTLENQGFKIFLETPQYLTIRAKFPDKGYDQYAGLAADFVLARKEGEYTDGRRPDEVIPGTLEDDLARRDFTMNAIAKDVDGILIDPFNGVHDIENKIIRAVGNPWDRLTEDALRAVRAIRFSVTKGFHMTHSLQSAIQDEKVLKAIREDISDERIMDELNKMLKFDTLKSLKTLENFPKLTEAIFYGRVSLEATVKTKGRGK